jgi:hypothetical protein
MLIVIYKIKKIAGWPARLTFLSCTPRELSHLLDLADRLGWEMHGNTGKSVTRETLSDEVERLTGNSAAVKGMLGTVSSPPANVLTPELSAEASEMLDAFILEALEAMAKEQGDE